MTATRTGADPGRAFSTRRPASTAALTLVVFSLLAACQTAADTAPPPGGGAYGPRLTPDDFGPPPGAPRPGATSIETGERGVIHNGDKLTYGLRIEQGGETTDLRLELLIAGDLEADRPDLRVTSENVAELLVMTTTDHKSGETKRFGSRVVQTLVHLRDVSGDHSVALEQLPGDFLGRGFDSICRSAEHWPPRTEGQSLGDYYRQLRLHGDDLIHAILTFVAVLNIVQSNELLAPLLQRLISTTDKIAYLFGGLEIAPDWQQTAPVTDHPGAGDLPVWSFPATISMGGRPVIHIEFLVTEPRAPLAITGGLLGFNAFRASDPTTRLSVALIEATPGSR